MIFLEIQSMIDSLPGPLFLWIIAAGMAYLFIAGLTYRYCEWKAVYESKTYWHFNVSENAYNEAPAGFLCTTLWPVWWAWYLAVLIPVRLGIWTATKLPDLVLGVPSSLKAWRLSRKGPKAYARYTEADR